MTIKKPRTIQIFLPTGDPAGIRIAEITTSIMRLIEVPRSDLSEFLKLPEATQVGLYFLVVGDNNDQLYIGQSGEVGRRLKQHHEQDKVDWDRALVLISLTHNLTQTHVLYLEHLSIEKATHSQRYELLNGNNGQKPYTPIPLKADCDEIHEIASLLLATLGYPIFDPLTESNYDSPEQQFVCTRSGVDAKAIYTNEGMIVLEGSSAPYSAKRKTDPRQIKKRDELLEKKVLVKQDDRVIFSRNYKFNTPSGASCFLVLGSSNGWTDWKTPTGETLHDHQGRTLDNATQ